MADTNSIAVFPHPALHTQEAAAIYFAVVRLVVQEETCACGMVVLDRIYTGCNGFVLGELGLWLDETEMSAAALAARKDAATREMI